VNALNVPRWKRKAEAIRLAWIQRQGRPPRKHEALLALSVAEHETNCGDAWPGENNWGAVQWRVPTKAEKDMIASGDLKAGSRVPGGALHRDSSPTTGAYWVWFRAFDSEIDGASWFVKILISDRLPCARVAEDDASSPADLAKAMYETGYYEGIHDPRKPGGREANIADYAGAITRIYYVIAEALKDWDTGYPEGVDNGPISRPAPATEPSPPPDDAEEAAPPTIPRPTPVPTIASWIAGLAALTTLLTDAIHHVHC